MYCLSKLVVIGLAKLAEYPMPSPDLPATLLPLNLVIVLGLLIIVVNRSTGKLDDAAESTLTALGAGLLML